MKNKKMLALLALTLTFSMGLTACSFGGKKEEEVVVETTTEATTEETTEETPADSPNMQVSTYTSADGKIAINLPDATWGVKMDQEDLYSFSSPDEGSILIEHGAGEEALSTQIVPNTQDLAETLEKGTAGEDYEIQNYLAAESDGNSTYTYLVKMLKKESDCAYKIMKFFANDSEFYMLTGTVLKDDNADLAGIRSAMDTFQILDKDSALSGLAAPVLEGTEGTKEEAEKPEETEEKEEAEETAETEEKEETPAQEPAAGGIAPSRDNPDNSDNTKTRTIYTNDGTGRAIVVTLNADGVWVDIDGNQYRFQGESDCYDQNDVDYYYHGEAADVYFLPVE